MEQRQQRLLRHLDTSGFRHKSLDDPLAQDPHRIITPPEDFQDDPSSGPATSLIDPPVMFRPWTIMAPASSKTSTSTINGSSEEDVIETLLFNEELQRLKSHSLFLQFPLDGSGQRSVHYRSSCVEYSSSSSCCTTSAGNQYRLRTDESVTEECTRPYYSESSEDEEEEEEEILMTKAEARLSSSSGLSNSQATTASSDADSGIDTGVSPRISAAAFGESSSINATISPSQSIMYIDSVSERNSVIIPSSSTPNQSELVEEISNSETVVMDEGIGPRSSVIAEGDPRRDRSHRVALELLNTERTYVDVLHLLDQVFQFRIDQENRAHGMFPQEMIPQMFSNIKSLFKLHHDFFLPKLEERLSQWDDENEESNRRIGDIMTSFAPFLKMYAEYVRNFDHATNLISSMTLKCPRFATLVDEIQQMPECGHLSLQHHMLTPIQRVPRYEMLLRDYLRRLPEDSIDRPETEKALHLVSTAANHANEAMKKIDQFKQLLEIQESLGGTVDLVSPTRELLKEGKIVKISARSGDHQERYLFLFTDLLLLCSPLRLIANRVMGSSSSSGLTPYRVRARFNIAQMEVLEGDNLETANTFYLREEDKTVELYTGTREEKDCWIDALFEAMAELTRRKSSLRISPNSILSKELLNNSDDPEGVSVNELFLGKTAPVLVRQDTVTRCFHCMGQFNVMRRKHHCHSCGKVACNRCSNHKMNLPYAADGTKALRVCDPCRSILSSSDAGHKPSNGSPLSSPEHPSPPTLRSGLLEVSVEVPSVLSGYLSLKMRGKTWQKRWFALRSDFVLYSYRSSEPGEDRAVTATPVPGFNVTLSSGSCNQLNEGQSPNHPNLSSKLSLSGDSSSGLPNNGLISERDRSFKMAHVHKTYHFQAGTRQEAEKWVQFLQMAARADLPASSTPTKT